MTSKQAITTLDIGDQRLIFLFHLSLKTCGTNQNFSVLPMCVLVETQDKHTTISL